MKKIIKAIMITGCISMISISMKAQDVTKPQAAIVKPVASDVKPTTGDIKPVAMIATSNITPAAKTVQQDKGTPKIATPPMPAIVTKPLAMQVPDNQGKEPVNMDRPKTPTVNNKPQAMNTPVVPIVKPVVASAEKQ